MLAVCLLTFITALTTAAPTSTPNPTPEPPNGIRQCARSECPVYTELADYGLDMWKRRIEPGVWARKVAPTCNRTTAIGLVYMDIHYYFRDNGINRTTPIMMEVSENKAAPSFCPDQSESFPCCDEIYALLFYIPAVSQATAPPPSKDSGVELVHMEDPREFYGITLGGRPVNENVTANYNQLSKYLDEQGIRFDDDAFLVASYDAPWRPQPHRNEILIPIKKPCRRHDGNDGIANPKDGQENETDQGLDGVRGREAGHGGRRQRRNVDYLPNIDLIPF
ncbi:uncharacterized protein LOC577534 isoform X1 [Strongylocentrotus purpuratus]|uniref:Uncharacterized protein n=2 Tax=Strongylocentrotus purpuratus TaxID=7668 RepID=A0A7M7PN21_STRPU|nr:uncharacterized protein LOC577534 isoform X1 [Strongylocentrotus purpuratus]XP_030853529.1 uncharacterized protein LOC577534 isoform X1 [Strongylocentrotus purpuratus]